MVNTRSAKPSITLIVSCSIFKEQFSAFMAKVEESAPLPEIEIVLVSRNGYDYRSIVADRFWAINTVIIGENETLNGARARAALSAQGDIVVFAEDHAHLRGSWVETLIKIYTDDTISAIGWTIKPGNLETIASWSGFLVEYGWWGPGVSTGESLTHLPGHNSSYRKSSLEKFSADLSRLMLAEGILHWKLVKQGDRIFFTTAIQSIHFEPFTLRELWLADFWYGWNFADTRQKFGHWSYGRRLFFAAAIWLKPLIRWRELAKTPRDYSFFPKAILWHCALPITATFFIATLGECLGHLFGNCGAARRLESYELATNRRVG